MEHLATKVLILLVLMTSSTLAESENVKNHTNSISCDLSATINITDGHLDQNGRFHHDGLIYENEMFAEFDFVIVNISQKIQVDPHIRGCVCELKKCLRVCRFCSNNDKSVDKDCVKTEILTVASDETTNIETEISLRDNSYTVLTGKACGFMVVLEPEEFDEDKWFFKVI